MEKAITKIHLDKSIESLARMVKKGFDGADKRFDRVDGWFEENKREHRQIFDRLKRIETKLDDVIYRHEFEELKARMKAIEEALAIN